MERWAYFFDGFNMYFSINPPQNAARSDNRWNLAKYKWLDYFQLAKVLTPGNKEIVSVNYFSAYRTWKNDSFLRHKTYVTALRTRGVTIVMGKYKKKERYCELCGKTGMNYHEEKETDVNIAVHMLRGAYLDEYDVAVLATADTDLLPVLKEIKSNAPAKKVGILFPINRRSNDLQNTADFHIRLKEIHLSTCQLPDRLIIGEEELKRPDEWTDDFIKHRI